VILPALIAGASVVGGLAHGAFHRNSAIFGPVLGRLPTRERVAALTFDDGPNPLATPRILDVLAEYGAHATFFFLGARAEKWPAIVQRAADEGHQIGNHGYFHRKLHFRSPSYIRQDISLGTAAITSCAGQPPAFFRAPHGFRNPWVSSIAASLQQRTVGWSLGVWDSDKPGSEVITARTLEGVKPGSIILLHDGDGYDDRGDRHQTAEALSGIIEGLGARGYTLSTLPIA